MASFGEIIQEISVDVESPDKSVRLTVTGEGDIQVQIAKGSLSRHTERSLARQVAAVVRLAIAARAKEYEQRFEDFAGRYWSERWW